MAIVYNLAVVRNVGNFRFTSIVVTTPPTKTDYEVDTAFDTEGMVVCAVLPSGELREISEYSWSPATISSDTTEVTIQYQSGHKVKTTTVAVTNYVCIGMVLTQDNRSLVGYTGEDDEVLVIPEKLQIDGTWYKFVTIASDAFNDAAGLTSITIPDTVTVIEEDAFAGCESVTDIYYGGSRADLANVTIGDGNDIFTTATIHYGRLDPFTFYINGISFTARDEMTWGVWLESDYNTDGFYGTSYGAIRYDDLYVNDEDENGVRANEEIVSGASYQLLTTCTILWGELEDSGYTWGDLEGKTWYEVERMEILVS